MAISQYKISVNIETMVRGYNTSKWIISLFYLKYTFLNSSLSRHFWRKFLLEKVFVDWSRKSQNFLLYNVSIWLSFCQKDASCVKLLQTANSIRSFVLRYIPHHCLAQWCSTSHGTYPSCLECQFLVSYLKCCNSLIRFVQFFFHDAWLIWSMLLGSSWDSHTGTLLGAFSRQMQL